MDNININNIINQNNNQKGKKNYNINSLIQKEIENKEKSNINSSDYFNKKEKDFSLEEFYDYADNKNQNYENNYDQNIHNNENNFKYNNFSLSNNIISNKNSIKENNYHYPENENKTNKYSNYNNILLDPEFDIKNIKVYDSIEEIAEWPTDLKDSEINGINDHDGELGDKLIHLESKNINNQNNDYDKVSDNGIDFFEITSLLKHKDTLRPYTPPIEELVQVNPNKMKGDNNVKCSIDKKNMLNTNRLLKNYENLVYNQDKGLFYDPKTNIYYDIKS